jgi:spore maturation protein CgeB
MRVGVVGPVGLDRFAENVSCALRRMGHEPILLGPARPRQRGKFASRFTEVARQGVTHLDEWTQQRLVRKSLKADCEIVICLDMYLMPRAVEGLRRNGARIAFWFPDAVSNLGRQLMLLAPYDAVFFKEPHIVERLQASLDLPVHYLPQACNPLWHRPLVPVGTEPYLVIAGGMYPSRVKLLERLAAKGIPLRLFGGKFPRWLGDTPLTEFHTGRHVFREEKARAFRSAAGVLNTMHPAEVSGVNVRLFEAAGCGAAVLTEFRATIPDLFDVGTEVLTYRDFDELVDQATRLLNNGALRTQLGDAAARRAHRDHTHDLRVATILEKLS